MRRLLDRVACNPRPGVKKVGQGATKLRRGRQKKAVNRSRIDEKKSGREKGPTIVRKERKGEEAIKGRDNPKREGHA